VNKWSDRASEIPGTALDILFIYLTSKGMNLKRCRLGGGEVGGSQRQSPSEVHLDLPEDVGATTTSPCRAGTSASRDSREATVLGMSAAAALACALLCIMPESIRAYSFFERPSLGRLSSSNRVVGSGTPSPQVHRRLPLSALFGPAFVPANIRRASVSKLFLVGDDKDEVYEGDSEEDDGEEYGEDHEEDEDEYVEDAYVPLEDDPDDPYYNAQKEMLEENLPRLQAVSAYKKMMRDQFDGEGVTEGWDKALNEFFEENLTKEDLAEAEKKAKQYEITMEDVQDLTDEDVEEAAEEINELGGEDAFPDDDPVLESQGITNKMLVSIDSAAKQYFATIKAMQDGTYEGYSTFDVLNDGEALSKLNSTDYDQYLELLTVLKEMREDDRPTHLSTKLLLYDLQFNMTNIFLAACKHNPDAPIILPQWLYQLEEYEKYADCQERSFEFTWEEADNADMAELEAYWKGLGYDEIPTKTAQETNIVTVEPPDDDEIQMSHMQEWMREVYDPQFDEVFFDDDSFMPYDSVFDEEYYQKDTPKDLLELQAMLDEIKQAVEDGEATEEEAKEITDYYDSLVSIQNITERIKFDSPEAAEFQGHLVVACSADDKDLEIAEKITERFAAEFGRRIFVETRVYGHAKEEDFLFEVWLESYDIDLLHSKRKATLSSQTWDGPRECDDAQIDFLVEEVRYYISEDHRYSYRIFEYEGIEEG